MIPSHLNKDKAELFERTAELLAQAEFSHKKVGALLTELRLAHHQHIPATMKVTADETLTAITQTAVMVGDISRHAKEHIESGRNA